MMKEFLKMVIGLSIFMSSSFLFASDIKCYFRTDLTNVGLAVGYFKGDGRISCDDGSSVLAEFSGWSVAAVGISTADFFDVYSVFTDVKNIQALEGRYHGGGLQLSVPLVLNLDLAVYTNGDTTLKIFCPAKGISVGLPYKTIDIRFTDSIMRPSKRYTDVLQMLSKAQLTFDEKGALALKLDSFKELPPFDDFEYGVDIQWLLEEDGILWDSDLDYNGRDTIEISQWNPIKPYYPLSTRDVLEGAEEYHLTLFWKGQYEPIPVVYRFTFTMPRKVYQKQDNLIPVKVERVHELDPF